MHWHPWRCWLKARVASGGRTPSIARTTAPGIGLFQPQEGSLVHEGYVVTRDRWTTSFSTSHPPALEVDPPAVIAFETSGAAVARLLAGVSLEEIGFANLNPVTGPVIVSGSEPGDALAIEVLEITVEQAWTGWFPGVGSLGGRTDRMHVREVPIRDGRVWVTDTVGVPLRPMIGCAGLAPAEGESATVVPAYPWGGNLDLREFEPGATLYLPVQTPGGYLSIGDLHAAMGTGERTAVSIECVGIARVRVTLHKSMSLTAPRLRLQGETVFAGFGADLAAAVRDAMGQAHDYLMEEHHMDPFEAVAYLSACCDARLGGPASPLALAVVPDPI
jgi:amidase